jgi:MFS family permease
MKGSGQIKKDILANSGCSRPRAWLIFTLSCLFYFYQFILQVSPDVLGPDLIAAFSAENYQLGLLSAAFFLSYTVMQIPAGILLDRYGSHRILTWASIICAISSVGFALAPQLIVAFIARLGMGIGAAFVFVGSLKLLDMWFPKKRFTLMTGILSGIGMLGAIGGEAPLSRIVAYCGWRSTILSLGLFGFLLSVLILVLITDSPSNNSSFKKMSFIVFKKELGLVFKNTQLWLVATYVGILAIPAITLCSLYGIPFLMAKYPIDLLTAARMVSLILLGTAVGWPVWGGISDYMRRRRPPLIIAAVISPLLLLLIVYYPGVNLIVPKILLFAFGFFCGASLPAYAIANEISQREHLATSLSIISALNTLGATLALPLLGRFLDIFWDGAVNQRGRVYDLSDYTILMVLMIAIMACSVFLLPFIKETYAKTIEE